MGLISIMIGVFVAYFLVAALQPAGPSSAPTVVVTAGGQGRSSGVGFVEGILFALIIIGVIVFLIPLG